MKLNYFLLRLLAIAGLFGGASIQAQPSVRQPNATFPQVTNLQGQELPEVSVFTAEGKPFSTAKLRGRYTVLVFGCLT